jgi:hypothetical protein
MEIIETTEILRGINGLLTPISLIMSIFVVFYAFISFVRSIKVADNSRFVALSLLGVGSIFLIEAAAITLILHIIATTNDRDVVNLVSNVRLLATNLLTIAVTFLLLGIYRNRI